MDEQSTRKAALLKPGTLSPNPWDLTPSGQNGWRYNEGTRTEDKAPQGCDLSAASSAGMAGAAAMLRPPQNIQIQTRQRLTYCRPNLVLTMGSTLGVPTVTSEGVVDFDQPGDSGGGVGGTGTTNDWAASNSYSPSPVVALGTTFGAEGSNGDYTFYGSSRTYSALAIGAIPAQ